MHISIFSITNSRYANIYSLNIFSSYDLDFENIFHNFWLLRRLLCYRYTNNTVLVLIYKIAFVCSHICIFPKCPNKVSFNWFYILILNEKYKITERKTIKKIHQLQNYILWQEIFKFLNIKINNKSTHLIPFHQL